MLMLPLIGAAMRERDLSTFVQFPPPLEIPNDYQRFSWLAAGAVIALIAALWQGNPTLGFVLAVAMILNLGLVAGLSGAVIPLLLKAMKFDPALGSGIVVTGLTDAFGFLSFLGLATLFIHYLT